ncbi:MAG TPA: hypothetical protein VJX94_00230 [Stellaceae bacterium]|nr:hypothetical protein [Stellaceae bacterium]
MNVIRTVREYGKSGVTAFHIEDQVSPKKCGHYEGKSRNSASSAAMREGPPPSMCSRG